jgi:serine/threonine protein kinase
MSPAIQSWTESEMEWELKPGDCVDRWTLTRRLKPGGNGEVWIAEHVELGQGALKLLKLRFQSEDHKRYRRFCIEAQKHQELARSHPGVLPFLGSALPENPTQATPAWLATRIAIPVRKALEGCPLRVSVGAVASFAETLATLHDQGISHRDIKPDNLFNYENRWVLGDFGLVDYPDKDSLTDTGERLGPYHYLAPEMLDEAKRSDGRKADVYSLGKTLWVLATEQQMPLPGEQRADNPQLGVGAYRSHAGAVTDQRIAESWRCGKRLWSLY